jgi:hypothetical protein
VILKPTLAVHVILSFAGTMIGAFPYETTNDDPLQLAHRDKIRVKNRYIIIGNSFLAFGES